MQTNTRKKVIKRGLLYFMAPIYILGGINHFLSPEFYLPMMPDYLPWHALLVALSGVIEILLGIAVLIPRLQKAAAWGIVLLLIAVFPANLNMYVNAEQFQDISDMALLLRLPMQGVLIVWAFWYTRD